MKTSRFSEQQIAFVLRQSKRNALIEKRKQ
jgi:hypothetical protein